MQIVCPEIVDLHPGIASLVCNWVTWKIREQSVVSFVVLKWNAESWPIQCELVCFSPFGRSVNYLC